MPDGVSSQVPGRLVSARAALASHGGGTGAPGLRERQVQRRRRRAPEPGRARIAGRVLRLTAIEFDFLRVLSLAAGQVVPTALLMRQVRGSLNADNADRVRAAAKAPQVARRIRRQPRLLPQRTRRRLPHVRSARRNDPRPRSASRARRNGYLGVVLFRHQRNASCGLRKGRG